MNKDIRHLRELLKQYQKLTDEALREYRALSQLMADERHASNLLNVKTALESLNERILKLNELRAQLQDVINTLETKAHAEAMLNAVHLRVDTIVKDLQELKQFRSNSEGRGQIIQILWPLIVGIIVFVLNKYFR